MAIFKSAATLLLLLAVTTAGAMKSRKEAHKGNDIVPHTVQCTKEAMVVQVPADGDVTGVELVKWDAMPRCKALRSSTHFTLIMTLDDLSCGTTRVWNKQTGKIVYYHRVAVASTSSKEKQTFRVECHVTPGNDGNYGIVKRDVLPPEFVEPDFIEITSEVTGTAPIPILGVGVRQNGQLVGGQINVRPGTPLTMEVFLDDTSAHIYGILMSYMEVTDTANKRETIIYNGCSVDPVLFDNFVTTSGDYVSSKFRAFKFPESNYVLFRGTVDVCLDKCQGIACSNGQLGYGRRRRGIADQAPDPNKIFEVTMTTFLKVDETFNGTVTEKRLEEEVENRVDRVAEDVEAVEQALKVVVEEERVKEATAAERALQEEGDAMPWGRPAIVSVAGDRASFQSSEREEPVYIYYNIAVANTQNLLLVALSATALLVLRWQ